MTDATDLWALVVASNEGEGLITLTNIRAPEATAILTAFGEDAAQEVIDLWPLYAQDEYDATNSQHKTVAKRGVIAVLWERGGASSTISEVEWKEVFGEGGLLEKLRRTDSRSRSSPVSNSGVRQRSELANGRAVIPWSHPDALPGGRRYMPRRIIAED